MNDKQQGITIIDDINSFKGTIPPYNDLIVFEYGKPQTAITLNGFDEIGMFEKQFKRPAYAFLDWRIA